VELYGGKKEKNWSPMESLEKEIANWNNQYLWYS